jgi:ABC-2 type transport system ATP-binding protein
MSAAIEFKNVSKRFGRIQALDDLSFCVPEGALFGLIGPNGAGKTSAFSVLAGYLKPDSGSIQVRGQPLLSGQAPRGRISMLPQDAELLPKMTAVQVLTLLARYGGLAKVEAQSRAENAIRLVGLSEKHFSQRVGNLSHGQRRRIGIAQTLLSEEEIICLDEPTAGLDPRAAAEIRSLITGLSAKRTIVFSSHNLLEVESICDHVAILDHGRLVSSGPMSALKNTDEVITFHLQRPLEQNVELKKKFEAIDFVKQVDISADRNQVHLQLQSESDSEKTVNEAISALMAAGGMLQSVERGQSLEQRFLEETKSKND